MLSWQLLSQELLHYLTGAQGFCSRDDLQQKVNTDRDGEWFSYSDFKKGLVQFCSSVGTVGNKKEHVGEP